MAAGSGIPRVREWSSTGAVGSVMGGVTEEHDDPGTTRHEAPAGGEKDALLLGGGELDPTPSIAVIGVEYGGMLAGAKTVAGGA